MRDKPTAFLINVAHRSGIDRAVFYAIISRVWSVGSFPATVFMIGTFLSKEEQGYYYTFTNILGITTFFELGLSQVVMHFASHEMAFIAWSNQKTLSGAPDALARLSSLLHIMTRWYGIISLIVLGVLLIAGFWFYGTAAHINLQIQWKLPWVLLVVASAAQVFLLPLWALLDGCGFIAQTSKIRTFQQIIGSIVLWITLAFHGALFGQVAMQWALVLVAMWWLARQYLAFFRALWHARNEVTTIPWREELLPMQWRIALSSIGSYLLWQIPTPILFRTAGPVAAGQWGISMVLAQGFGPIAGAWVQTKAPIFGKYVATHQFSELDRLFARLLKQSSVILGFGLLLVLGSILLLDFIPIQAVHAYADRFLPPMPLALLLIGSFASHFHYSFAFYLRSYRREGMLAVTIAYGVTMATLSAILIPIFGVTGAALAFACSSTVVGAGVAYFVFLNKRQAWQKQLTERKQADTSIYPSQV